MPEPGVLRRPAISKSGRGHPRCRRDTALADGAGGNGGGTPGRQVGEAFVELQSRLAELERREIVLRDLDRGLIDFPAVRDGREVYLCWVDGEPDIAFWHELDAGYAGRQAL